MEIYRLGRQPNSALTDFSANILSGRGCTFKCNFCYRLDEGFRPRAAEAVAEEIKLLKTDYRINYVAFYDEFLMSSVKRATQFCEVFLKERLNVKWNCNGRLNYAKPELLKLMKRAGCVFINYGIESFDDAVLRNMGKSLNTTQVTAGVEATLAAGISPGLNIIFGNIGDSRETLRESVEFLLKYDDGAQLRTIRPVTPYPGGPLYYEAIRAGLLRNCEDFYENKHVNSDLMAVNFTNMTNDEYYAALHDANMALLKNYHDRSARKIKDQLHQLYHNRDAGFRGFRAV